MKIRPVGAKLFHKDGRTDREIEEQTWRSISRFSQFGKKPLKLTITKEKRLFHNIFFILQEKH